MEYKDPCLDGIFIIIRCLGLFTVICLGFKIINLYFGIYFIFGMFNSNSSSILYLGLPFALKVYSDPIDERTLIREENKDKSGVYAWLNKTNGKLYVGSGDPIYRRISDYYKPSSFLARPGVYILRALSKHGMVNFELLILEYADSENLIACEQKWIDLLKPDYNLNPLAKSSKGYKHTIETLEKLKNRIISFETKLKMSKSAKERLKREGKLSPFEGKKHTEKSLALLKAAAFNRTKLHKVGVEVEITDLETKLTTTYESIRKAAKAINSDIKSLSRHEKLKLEKGSSKPYRNRYVINIKRT